MPLVYAESPGKAWELALIDYLIHHEEDIAMSINDYADLLLVFIEHIGREPRASN